jgi:protein phosphatase
MPSLDASYLTDRGHARPINEDYACAIIPDDPAILATKGVLMIVADGMGGHEAGELASRMTVECMRSFYYETAGDPHTTLTGALDHANRVLLRHARIHPDLTGMGTTCTAIAVVNGCAWLAHVGDTRLYLVRDGSTYRMTQDHSATMDLVKRGLLTLAQADRHPERNLILRAVGVRDKLDATTWHDGFPVRTGDRLIIGSDGFYETLDDHEIGSICTIATTSAHACELLLKTALERDGSDNLTVAVLFVNES